MQPQAIIDLTREALLLALLVAAPLLIAALAMGLAVGLLQSVTQIQDQSVGFVPKLLALIAAFAVSLPWLLERMTQYSEQLFVNATRMLGGG